MAGIREKYGKATVTKGPRYKTLAFNIKKNIDTLVFRLLPPMKSLVNDPQGWKQFVKVHYGYSVPNPKNNAETFNRLFHCIEEKDFRTQMVKVSCGECRNIAGHKQAKDDLEKEETDALKAQGVLNDKEIEKLLAPKLEEHVKWLKAHNVDYKSVMAGLSPEGEPCLVKVAGKCQKLIDAKIKSLREDKDNPIDPFDFDSGVYFVCKRSGTWNQTSFTVEVLTEPGPVKGSYLIKPAPVTDEQLTLADEVLPDLSDLPYIAKLSKDEIQLLVESNGDPDAVASVFALLQPEPSEGGGDDEAAPAAAPTTRLPPAQKAPTPAAPAQPKPTAVAAPKPAAPKPTAPVGVAKSQPPSAAKPTLVQQPAKPHAAPAAEQDEEAALMAQLAALKAKKAQTASQKAQEAAPEPEVEAAPEFVEAVVGASDLDPMDPNMSPEDFANMFPPPDEN